MTPSTDRPTDGAPMRIAFVVPRYGPAIIGGAETAARLLAAELERDQTRLQITFGVVEVLRPAPVRSPAVLVNQEVSASLQANSVFGKIHATAKRRSDFAGCKCWL